MGFARHYMRRPVRLGFKDIPPRSYTPVEIAGIYNFPANTTGKGQTIGILELGGAFSTADLAAYFAALNLPVPSVVAVSVDGAQPVSDGPDGADGEVMLDIEVAGAVAPGAAIKVYFAPNTSAGFLHAVQQAIADNVEVLSISWGGPEDSWQQADIQALSAAFTQAAQAGITVCAAAGDLGSSDGERGRHVDYPASDPCVLACGGTTLLPGAPPPWAESVWNDGRKGGATGGGVSSIFAQPAWQAGARVPAHTRGVPDVAGDADPDSGYQVRVDGQDTVIGGTSAVAPLWAGLVARLNEALGRRVGFLNPLLYQLGRQGGGVFNDVTRGHNGLYIARPGWDACTGWGSPNGTALLAALKAASAKAA